MSLRILSRFHWYRRSRSLYHREKKNHHDAPYEAELKAMKKLERMENIYCVHHALRIPKPSTKFSAGEIDVLAITKWGVLLVEVKHWSDEVDLFNADFRQRKCTKPKKVLSKLLAKAEDLKRNAVSMLQDDAFEVESVVLFTNRNVKLSEEMMDHPSVATYQDLEEKINRKLAHRTPLTRVQLQNYRAMISTFATWDVISTGHQKIHGDIADERLPYGWRRDQIKAVKITLVHGLFSTLWYGPRIALAIEDWEGNRRTKILSNPTSITHTAPWKSGGIDGKGTYPLDHLHGIEFGFRYPPFHKENIKRLPSPSENIQPTLSHTNTSEKKAKHKVDYMQRFAKGTKHKGTVVKHLIGDDGSVYALLIALIERKVTGMLRMKELDHLNPEVFQMFYAEGKPVEVQVLNYNGQKNIQLTTR